MAEEGPETTEPQPIKINPEILDSLGLSPDDVQRHDSERLELVRYREASKKIGSQYYVDKRSSVPLESYSIGDFALPHDTSRQEFPEATMSRFEETKTRFNPDVQNKYLVGIKGLLEGYGAQAISEYDWVSGINAYDVATEGGIMQNQEVLGQLKEIAQSNKTSGVDIAKAIQERINRKNGGSAQTEHRPAPPAPPSD